MENTARILLFLIVMLGHYNSQAQIMDRFKQKVKDKANNKVDQKLDNAAEKVVNAPENAANNAPKQETAHIKNTPSNSGAGNAASTGGNFRRCWCFRPFRRSTNGHPPDLLAGVNHSS